MSCPLLQENMKNAYDLKRFKRRMNRNKTRHEKMVFDILSEMNIEFKTQLILGYYILDFILVKHLLVIEVDGNTHEEGYDRRRDEFIRNCGLNVTHIKNADVNKNSIGDILSGYSEVDDYLKKFRHALSMGNVFRSKAINKLRELDSSNHSLPTGSVRQIKRDNTLGFTQTHSNAS